MREARRHRRVPSNGLEEHEQRRVVADLGERAAATIHTLAQKHRWTFEEFSDVYELAAHAFQDGQRA